MLTELCVMQMKAQLEEEGIEYTDPLYGGNSDHCDVSPPAQRFTVPARKRPIQSGRKVVQSDGPVRSLA